MKDYSKETHEHHHEHEEHCSCGHDHSHEEHEHEHHHEHEEHCSCGHDHSHEEHEHEHHHEHEEHCSCGHDHSHEEHEHEHHHEHEEHCSCGHDHSHEEHEHEHHHHEHEEHCSCGHDHSHEEQEHEHHHHEHEEHCSCGHDHSHEEHEHEHHHHEHEEHCSCGHDHSHEEHAHHHAHTSGGGTKCVFILENLGCAHCASKMEEKIQELPGVSDATITFATKQLRITAERPQELLPEIQKICTSIESEVKVIPRDKNLSGACKTKTYILENLGCAHCASKMEEQIGMLDGVEEVTITFATKQLRVTAKNPDRYLPDIRRICTSIESEVQVIPRKDKSGSSKTKTYILENLGCAHCASKMEEQIGMLDGVEEATITFATKQLRITAKNPDRYLPDVRKICTSIESEVQVREKEPSPKKVSAPSHEVPTSGTPKKVLSKEKKELISIIVGAVLFIAGEVLEHMGMNIPSFLVLVAAYILLGGKVLLNAVKNISHGQIFDENFLMSIATLGAFGIREYPEAVGVMLFYRIGEFFEHKAVERSRGQIMDAVDMRPEVVNLIVGDEIQVIPAEDAQIGDILMIRPGDRIPLDGTITEGSSRLDTSPITGEPVPVAVSAGDEVTSGCVNTSGQIKIRVEKLLEDSMVTRILDSVENAAASKPKIDRFITRFAKVYTPCVVLIALATAAIPSLISGNWNYWIYTALTFLVMSCPCALVLSVPLAFFSGIGAGSKKGILFKGGVSIESLSHLGAVVMDKTGTVTKGNFQLQKVVSTGAYTEDELLRICAGCEQNSTHPIAHSIVTSARDKGLNLDTPFSLKEIAGHGILAAMPEGEVLCGNRKLMDKYKIKAGDLKKDSYGSEVFLAINGKFAGYLLISDTIKPEARSAISRLKTLGLRTVMLTGDSKDSAEAVAKETGIDDVYAKLLPQDKLDILTKVRSQYGSVMFVGDGINDAPVLAGADVGAAMGSGADAAIEAADAVFMNSSVESIPDSIAIARSTNRIALQNVVFALIIKVAVMILGLAGFANMWMAVFADTGVAMLCVLNSIRVLYKK